MFLSQRQNGYFFIQFFDPKLNKFRRVSTGTKNKSQAIKYLTKFQYMGQNETELPAKILLEDFKNEYVSYVEGVRSQSYTRSIKLSFRKLSESIGNCPIIEIHPKLLDQFIVKRFSVSPAAAILYYSTLKAAFSKAVTWGYINENPLKKVKPPKKMKCNPIFITVEQLGSMLTNESRVLFRDLFTFAFYTGMRLSEITNLRCSWIDLTNKIITVKNSEIFSTKSKKERVIPINSDVMQILNNRYSEALKNKQDYIFYRIRGRKLDECFVSKQFKYLVRKTGLDEKIHFHSLRHSFASRLVQKGASIFVVKELLGHEDIKTTQIYSHLQTQNLVEAIRLL